MKKKQKGFIEYKKTVSIKIDFSKVGNKFWIWLGFTIMLSIAIGLILALGIIKLTFG